MKAVCLIFNKIQVGHWKIIPTDRPFMSSLESALFFCSPVHSLTNPSFSQISACLRYHPVIFFLLNNFYDEVTKTRTVLIFDRYEQRCTFAYHAHSCQWTLITWTKKIIAPVAFLVSLLHFCVALKKPLFSPSLYPQRALLPCGQTLLSNSRR